MAKKKELIRNYYRFDMDLKLMNALASILYIIFFIYLFSNTYFDTFDFSFLALIILFLYFALHEICHGIGYALYTKNKKNIKFGAILEKGVFYAMCQEEISKKGIIVSLIFPIIILTIIPLPFALYFKNSLVFFLAITNLIGAIGDIFLIKLVLKLPNDITYIDYDNNIGAYFICNEDISNIKSLGLKCAETNKHEEKLINQDIKSIYISDLSKKIFIIFGVILILLFIINMI